MAITWAGIAAVCGGIILLWNVGEKVYKIIKPAADWKKRVDDQQKELQEVRSFTDRDYKALEDIQEILKGVVASQIAIMDHMIEGNHTEAMKKTRNDMMDLMKRI